MKNWNFEIEVPLKLKPDGKPYPIGKKAPQLVRGKFVAGASYKQEQHIKRYVAKWYRGEPFDGPVELAVIVFLPNPKKPKNKLYPITAPDLDNCTKMLQDALEGILFTNDSRIVNLFLAKRFVENELAKPRIKIKVRFL